MPQNPQVRCLLITGDAVGGIRLHVHAIVHALLSRGMSVAYACSHTADTRGEDEILRFMAQGVPVHRMAVKKLPHWSDLNNLLKLRRFALEQGVNMVHGHGAKGGLYARALGRLLGVPVVYTPHGGVVHATFNAWATRLYAAVERKLIANTRVYLFESEYTRNAFLRLVNRGSLPDARVNLNGLDLSAMQAEPLNPSDSECPTLLVLGMLRREKGQHILLDALRVLRDRGVKCHLVVAGDGSERQTLENRVREFNLSERVTFTGDVKDPSPLLLNSAIVVIPSLFESFGYVALEAALHARPVVASAVGGLMETVIHGTTGLHVKPGDAHHLADALQSLLADPERRRALGLAARQHCLCHFSQERMLQAVLNVYGEVAVAPC